LTGINKEVLSHGDPGKIGGVVLGQF